MKCPQCGKVVMEIYNSKDELFFMCEDCEMLVMETEDGTYKMVPIYNADDVEATMHYEDDLVLKELHLGEPCMSDYVHKCLRCNAYGFEVAPGEFECADCGFSWEVHNFE